MEAVAEWYQPSLRQRLEPERLADARLQIQGVLEACGLLQTADRITGCEATGFAHEAMFEAFLRYGLREMVEDVERYAEMICGAGQRGRLLEGLARYLQRRTYYEPTAVTGFAEFSTASLSWAPGMRRAGDRRVCRPSPPGRAISVGRQSLVLPEGVPRNGARGCREAAGANMERLQRSRQPVPERVEGRRG